MARNPSGSPSESRGDNDPARDHHAHPGDEVTEGGPAKPPKDAKGTMKGSASHAADEGAVAGEDTSRATAGMAEKQRAAEAGAEKTQAGRGHRKHED